MRMKEHLLSAMLILLLDVEAALAQTSTIDQFDPLSSQALYVSCAGIEGTRGLKIVEENLNECVAFINGFYSGWKTAEFAHGVAKGQSKSSFCPPESGANAADLAAVFVTWMKKNKDKWNEPKIVGLFLAWKEKWPCPSVE